MLVWCALVWQSKPKQRTGERVEALPFVYLDMQMGQMVQPCLNPCFFCLHYSGSDLVSAQVLTSVE
jgi:hypothetical protein